MEKINDTPKYSRATDQERLKTLYAISKKLSVFKDVEESFPGIVSCAAESFPLISAVLIEHWEKTPRTAVWFAAGASKATVANAILNAKTSYSYLAGSTILQSADFLEELANENELSPSDRTISSDKNHTDNFIFLPLMIDNLPPLGALQLEGAGPLDEKDLDFVNALTNLVSVALDRFYRAKREQLFNQEQMRKNLESISESKNKVHELEMERALREDFVSLLTHDLKSPLSVIMAAAELIIKKHEAPERCLKLGGMIVKQSQLVVKMINNLLDANQIRSGQKLVLSLQTISLNSLVIDEISDLRLVHGDRFGLEADHPIEIHCDVNGIKRILENLCNNAIKYGSPDTLVKIILDETNDDILITVHNLGKPIPLEDQKTIFKQFHRSPDALLGNSEGWGIGLTLVRGVAEAHGGSIEVKSDAESGTSFIVKLPKDMSLLN